MSARDSDVVAAAVARVHAPGGLVAGAGVLLAPDLVATCAHVVADALGHDDVPVLAPDTALRLDLPFAPGDPVRSATVWRWWAPAPDGSGDVALLRLDAPVGVPVPSTRRREGLWGRPCRLAGFPPGREDGVWSTGVLRGSQGSGWFQLADTTDVGPGFSGAPVLDEHGAVVALAVAADRDDGGSAYAIPIDRVLAQAPELLANPYRGLAAFGEADRDLFFGREGELVHAMGVLEREGLLVLVGGSGTGKSSLLDAAVVPAARVRGRRPGRVRLAGVASRGEVVSAFAAALVEATSVVPATHARLGSPAVDDWDRRAWARLLTAGPDEATAVPGRVAPAVAVRAVDAAAVARAGLLVVVDQLEDLAVAAPAPARTAVDVVSTLAALGVWVALTARWATVDDLLDGRSAPTLQRAVVGVLPPGRDRLRAAVAEPAARVPGPSFDPGVVARIVDDAGDEPGRLPLVAVLLAELWDAAEDGRLTLDTYRRVGTVQGALVTAAERTWDELGTGRRARARALLVAMTRPDEAGGFVRHPVLLASLDPGRRRVAEALAAARLVVIGPGPRGDVAELAHQSLIDRWPRLRGWLQADGEFLRWRAQVAPTVAAWESTHDRDLLLRGTPLETAGSWLAERTDDLSETEAAFVRTGLRRDRLERRLRGATLVVVVTLGVLVGVLLASAFDTPVSAWCRSIVPAVGPMVQWGGSVPTS